MLTTTSSAVYKRNWLELFCRTMPERLADLIASIATSGLKSVKTMGRAMDSMRRDLL
jgi:hypothetical protein